MLTQKLAGPVVGQSAEAGSRAIVHAATSPDMAGKHVTHTSKGQKRMKGTLAALRACPSIPQSSSVAGVHP